MADTRKKKLGAESPPLNLKNIDQVNVPGVSAPQRQPNEFTELGLLVQGFAALGQDPGAQAIGRNLVDVGKQLQKQQALKQRDQQTLDLEKLKFDAKAKQTEASGQAIIATARDLVNRQPPLLSPAQLTTIIGQVQAGRIQDASKTLGVAAANPEQFEQFKKKIQAKIDLTPDIVDKFDKLVRENKIDPTKETTPKRMAALLDVSRDKAKGIIEELQEQKKLLPTGATTLGFPTETIERVIGTTEQEKFLERQQQQRTISVSRNDSIVPSSAKGQPEGTVFRIQGIPNMSFKLID